MTCLRYFITVVENRLILVPAMANIVYNTYQRTEGNNLIQKLNNSIKIICWSHLNKIFTLHINVHRYLVGSLRWVPGPMILMSPRWLTPKIVRQSDTEWSGPKRLHWWAGSGGAGSQDSENSFHAHIISHPQVRAWGASTERAPQGSQLQRQKSTESVLGTREMGNNCSHSALTKQSNPKATNPPHMNMAGRSVCRNIVHIWPSSLEPFPTSSSHLGGVWPS